MAPFSKIAMGPMHFSPWVQYNNEQYKDFIGFLEAFLWRVLFVHAAQLSTVNLYLDTYLCMYVNQSSLSIFAIKTEIQFKSFNYKLYNFDCEHPIVYIEEWKKRKLIYCIGANSYRF